MPRYVPMDSFPMRAHQAVRPVLLAPSPLLLALSRVSHALAATTALLAPHHGLVLIVAEATTAPTALALQRPAPTKCPLLADGALSESKALHSSWKQPPAVTSASGTSRQATAYSANANQFNKVYTLFHYSRFPGIT